MDKTPGRVLSSGRALLAILLVTLFFPLCFAVALPYRLGPSASGAEGINLVVDISIAGLASLLFPALPTLIVTYFLIYSPLRISKR